ncbi:hypothetical protein SNE40_007863 [Patella caerulea]|uniref:Uncharacterized protein n=1 Tax=Patella caerulea TaxID=87958 RepID=A0AAN8PVP9_PATCE
MIKQTNKYVEYICATATFQSSFLQMGDTDGLCSPNNITPTIFEAQTRNSLTLSSCSYNHYPSVQLCDDMFDKQIYMYVTGTVRSNRKNLTDEVKKIMKKKGDLIEIRRDNLMAANEWTESK